MRAIRELEYPSYAAAPTPTISWRAVFAGSAICLCAAAALGLLGLAVGALRSTPPVLVLPKSSPWALVWLLAADAAAFYCGGWVASRTAGLGSISDSVLHGLTSWGVSTLAASLLLANPVATFFGIKAVQGGRLFGWAGFLLFAVGAAASAWGARGGARLRMPVPVEVYRRARQEETAHVPPRG